MMRLLLSFFALYSVLSAAFDPHPWESRRSVKTTVSPFNVVIVDATSYASSRAQLRDLRLLRAGQEVPYVLRTLAGSREEKRFTPSVINKAAIPGAGVQVVLDVGENVLHDRVNIETSKLNFKQQVLIETSDDGQTWGVVRRDGIIFDVSTVDHHSSNSSVSYPDSTRRFVRVTVDGWRDPSDLLSTSISFFSESAATRDLVANLRPTVRENAKERQTELDFDLGFPTPYDRILLSVGPGLFSRSVKVATGSDKKSWYTAGFATIARTAAETQVTVEFSEQWQQYVRLTISNEDNGPLSILSGQFQALRRELIFPADEAGQYWLYSGNPTTEIARYDLSSVLPETTVPLPAVLGPVERNPEYQPKVPIAEKSPWLLTALVIILVPVMAIVAFRCCAR